MGIKQLFKLIKELAPKSIKEIKDKKYLQGRVLAIDASMALYQFVIATRNLKDMGANYGALTNEDGEITSHLMGFWNRTIDLMEKGLKPVYVFDGKPPCLKSGELAKRIQRKEKAIEEFNKAEEEGNINEMAKQAGRTVRITKEMKNDTIELLKAMGVPIVEAPCEAEASAAELVKNKKAYAVVSEDMDTLTFGS